ncbi:DMT family transporter [Brevibacillus humidisoli]|uniref:DMT family transporter n=1 Tax=Brevibacillus humidisoli TaxID=2895522 RepID=UPI001E6581AD|nr:DMT family transporter [Brevibacillus humidisoli]UFJ39982.1 DMT family transporter [Brevibacillus humidisoli]
MKKWLTEWLLWSVVLIWGANYTIGKYGVVQLSPLQFNTIRFVAAGPLLLLATYLVEKSVKIDRKDFIRLVVVSLVGVICYQTLFMASIKYTSATNAALLIAMSPVFTGIFSVMAKQETFSWRVQIGSVIAFGGAAMVIIHRGDPGSAPDGQMLGDIMGLLAAISWGLYPVITTPLLKTYSALRVTTWSIVIGALILFPLVFSDLLSAAGTLTASTWSSLLYSAILVTAYGLVAWYVGISKIGSTKTMVYMYVTPLVASIIAWLFIGETIQAAQIMGGNIILAGLYMVKSSQYTQKRRQTAKGG